MTAAGTKEAVDALDKRIEDALFEDCDECGGTGMMYGEYECDACHGRGWLGKWGRRG